MHAKGACTFMSFLGFDEILDRRELSDSTIH